MVASASSVRSPHGLPFPYKEDLAFLTSEEEERLIYGRDMSVINEKIKDIPEQIVVAPPSPDGSLPIPTMDPPLPPLTRKKRPRKKSNRGFPFKVPRALSMLSVRQSFINFNLNILYNSLKGILMVRIFSLLNILEDHSSAQAEAPHEEQSPCPNISF